MATGYQSIATRDGYTVMLTVTPGEVGLNKDVCIDITWINDSNGPHSAWISANIERADLSGVEKWLVPLDTPHTFAGNGDEYKQSFKFTCLRLEQFNAFADIAKEGPLFAWERVPFYGVEGGEGCSGGGLELDPLVIAGIVAVVLVGGALIYASTRRK